MLANKLIVEAYKSKPEYTANITNGKVINTLL